MFEELLAMATVGPSTQIKAVIQERVAARKCLCCDRPLLKRGLCYQCYYAWRNTKLALPTKSKQLEFDAKLIRDGKLLPAQGVRQYTRDSVFNDVAKSLA